MRLNLILSFAAGSVKRERGLCCCGAKRSGKEWERLTRLYAEKSNEELVDLAEDFGNLTEVAQQVLRDEMRKRKLVAPEMKPVADNRAAFGRWSQAGVEKEQESDAADVDSENDEEEPVEYTWKTLLCECDDQNQAWQIGEVLRRAGIESWLDGPRSESSLDVRSPQVFVAADQLEEARAIVAKPISQDVIDQSKEKVEDFEPPTCPKCGASDPLLESVDPSNNWLCESCGDAMERSGAGGKRGTKPGPKIGA
jgi:hypothetical protein